MTAVPQRLPQICANIAF